MRVNLLALDSERFEELCQALLTEEYERFQPFSAPDLGMDGYDPDSKTIFQAYFPKRTPRKDKIQADLEKAKQQGDRCKRWVLMLPKNLSANLSRWLQEEQLSCPFEISIWGHTRLQALLHAHKSTREQFFPTELQDIVKRIASGRKPTPGDAAPGQEISPEEAAELRLMIEKLAEEAARRKRRKPDGRYFQNEYRELKSHFKLSSYDRLPREKFIEARRYLEKKLYARRRGETRAEEYHRAIRTIHTIQKVLKMRDSEYRELLFRLTGKTSTTQMGNDELLRVGKHFKHLQGLAESKN